VDPPPDDEDAPDELLDEPLEAPLDDDGPEPLEPDEEPLAAPLDEPAAASRVAPPPSPPLVPDDEPCAVDAASEPGPLPVSVELVDPQAIARTLSVTEVGIRRVRMGTSSRA
jgi:hypothetical protein